MRIERFTTLAQEALANAQGLAVRASNADISPLHLLAALLETQDGVATSILDRAGIDGSRVLEVTQASLSRMPTVTGGSVQTSQQLVQVLANAEEFARKMKDQYVSTEHLLLALVDTPSEARDALSTCGADKGNVKQAIEDIRKASGVSNVTDPGAERTLKH